MTEINLTITTNEDVKYISAFVDDVCIKCSVGTRNVLGTEMTFKEITGSVKNIILDCKTWMRLLHTHTSLVRIHAECSTGKSFWLESVFITDIYLTFPQEGVRCTGTINFIAKDMSMDEND